MKKILVCGLILSVLGSYGNMCLAFSNASNCLDPRLIVTLEDTKGLISLDNIIKHLVSNLELIAQEIISIEEFVSESINQLQTAPDDEIDGIADNISFGAQDVKEKRATAEQLLTRIRQAAAESFYIAESALGEVRTEFIKNEKLLKRIVTAKTAASNIREKLTLAEMVYDNIQSIASSIESRGLEAYAYISEKAHEVSNENEEHTTGDEGTKRPRGHIQCTIV